MEKTKKRLQLSASALHILAMVFMLCDHIWGTFASDWEILTCIGRLAFPIFAFMIVEGFYHTGNVKKYILRLLILALLSEIPFNLMFGAYVFYPYHQNVIWTFLIALLLICMTEKAKQSGKKWLFIVSSVGAVLIGYLAGFLSMADYYGPGVLTVLAFYFFRERKWWKMCALALCLYYINIEMLSGLYYEVELFGKSFNIVRQGFALLALIPIWLYNGKKGISAKSFQYFRYAFYPAHMLILTFIALYIIPLFA